MSVLLLRLAGPMQSWGVQSRFSIRDTGREPSKSGVVGLLCAALGLPRSEPVDELAALRMGIRVDREGALKVDYHTAGGGTLRGAPYGVAKASGARPETVVSRRYYLADANFLVGLESADDALLGRLDRALAAPVWQLCLGRKAFVPGVPVRLPEAAPNGPGLRLGQGLEDALASHPWHRDRGDPGARPESPPPAWRFVVELAGSEPGAETRLDQPVGAAFLTRRFTARYVRTELRTGIPIVPPDAPPPAGAPVPTDLATTER